VKGDILREAPGGNLPPSQDLLLQDLNVGKVREGRETERDHQAVNPSDLIEIELVLTAANR